MSCRTTLTARKAARGRNRWLARTIALLSMLTTTTAAPDEIKLRPPALDLRHRELDSLLSADPAPCYPPADCAIASSRLTEIPARSLVGGPPTSPVVRLARGFKHEGLPLAVLWQSPRNRISIGINSHGTPGLWYLQRQN